MTIEEKLKTLRIAPDGATPLAVRIAGELAARVDSGQLAAGERLPPTKRAAELLGVSIQVAHDALTLLVSQGKLVRKQRVGTIVGRARQRTIGLLTKVDPRLPVQSNFGWLIAQAFGEVAEERGWRHRQYIIGLSGDEARLSECLVQDILESRLDALLVGACPPEVVTRRFPTLPIPLTTIHGVMMDKGPAVAEAVRWLVAQGADGLALVNPNPRDEAAFRAFADTCAAAGVPDSGRRTVAPCRSSVESGRELYGALFGDCNGPPDGLIVLDDMIAFGLIQQGGEGFLDRVRVAVQVNRGSRLHLSDRCALIEIDWRDLVDAVFGQIEAGAYYPTGSSAKDRVALRFVTPEEAARRTDAVLAGEVV